VSTAAPPEAGGRRGGASRLVRSVRFRITAVAAVAVAVVLVLASVLLLSVQRRQLTDSLDASLARRADDLSAAALDLAARSPTTPVVLANAAGDDAVVQIVADGIVIAGTENAIGVEPIGTAPAVPGDSIVTIGALPVDENSGLEELDFPCGRDRGFDASTTDQRISMDRSLHHSIFADNYFALRMHLTVQTSIDAHRTLNLDFTPEFDSLCQQRNVAVVCITSLFHGDSSVQASLPPRLPEDQEYT